MAYSQPVIESGSSRAGRWLKERRLKLALWIAALEGLVVALRGDVSRWTVIAIAALVLIIYMLVRQNLRWDAARQVVWIVAASQVMAVLVVWGFSRTVDANQLQHETARIGGILLIIGVLHGVNLLALPVMNWR